MTYNVNPFTHTNNEFPMMIVVSGKPILIEELKSWEDLIRSIRDNSNAVYDGSGVDDCSQYQWYQFKGIWYPLTQNNIQ